MASTTEASLGSLPASAANVLTPPQKTVNSASPPAASSETIKPQFFWMVKPCFLYKEEYKDCKSFKARFHQYFVYGHKSECKQWKEDYDNCVLWEDKKNSDALKKVIDSEKTRVRQRLRAHYANDVWEHRTSPPADWNKELPASIKTEYEQSYLKKKAEELKNGTETLGNFRGAPDELDTVDDESSSCSIM